MQAIQTTYFEATNFKGSRIKAECQARKIFVSWDYSLDIEDNHKSACQQLLDLLEWNNMFFTGQLKDGSYVHVIDFNNFLKEKDNGF